MFCSLSAERKGEGTRTFLLSLFLLVAACSMSQVSQLRPSGQVIYELTLNRSVRIYQATLRINFYDGSDGTYDGTFTGTLTSSHSRDSYEREIFGWVSTERSPNSYVRKILSFYVVPELPDSWKHQQLFKGVLSHDKSEISGTFFYWGNEFGFHGERVL